MKYLVILPRILEKNASEKIKMLHMQKNLTELDILEIDLEWKREIIKLQIKCLRTLDLSFWGWGRLL